ncbi:hypothetical protein [Falsirhodobacter deserti]|nr:hypothetical protein [Falsirhodobacter deserti]
MSKPIAIAVLVAAVVVLAIIGFSLNSGGPEEDAGPATPHAIQQE